MVFIVEARRFFRAPPHFLNFVALIFKKAVREGMKLEIVFDNEHKRRTLLS